MWGLNVPCLHPPPQINPNESTFLNFTLYINETVYLWWVPDPELYVVEVQLFDATSQALLDNITANVGFRTLQVRAMANGGAIFSVLFPPPPFPPPVHRRPGSLCQ